MSTTAEQRPVGGVNAPSHLGGSSQIRLGRVSETVVLGRRRSPSESPRPFIRYFAPMIRDYVSDSGFNHSHSTSEWRNPITTLPLWQEKSEPGRVFGGAFVIKVANAEVVSYERGAKTSVLRNTSALEQMLSEKLSDDPEFGARARKRLEQSALIRRLALEQNSVSFDPVAGAILGRIYDRGHATCEDLADWLESPEEWIAFSRLQRARLLYDSGTEFTVSPDGRQLIYRILNDISVLEGSAE